MYVKLFTDNRKRCLKTVTFYISKVNSQIFSVYIIHVRLYFNSIMILL